jgi:hypothetical protein
LHQGFLFHLKIVEQAHDGTMGILGQQWLVANVPERHIPLSAIFIRRDCGIQLQHLFVEVKGGLEEFSVIRGSKMAFLFQDYRMRNALSKDGTNVNGLHKVGGVFAFP